MGVLQRPLSLVSFISRPPAGNGSLRVGAKRIAPALRGKGRLEHDPEKACPELGLVRDR